MEQLLQLLQRVARKSCPASYYGAALCYATGVGCRPRQAKASAWFRKAADNRHAEAQCELGFRYEKGIGVRKDVFKAFDLYAAAARSGIVEAQYNVAVLFELGLGVRRDYAQAANWYRRAADRGDKDAAFRLGVLYMTAANLRAAKRWFLRAALAGHVDAQFNLALLLETNRGRSARAKAVHWYRAAANRGDSAAANNLGVLYTRSALTVHNTQRAFHWFSRSAALSDPKGLFNLGMSYENGEGVAPDMMKAVEAYIGAASLHHPLAIERLTSPTFLAALQRSLIATSSNFKQKGCTDTISAKPTRRFDSEPAKGLVPEMKE